MELRPGLHRIDTRLGERLLSLYLLVGSAAAVLFDTGVPGTVTQHVLPYLDRAGIDPALVRTVVLSHCDVDHFGGAEEARTAFPRALVVAHEDDADMIADRRCYDAGRARPFRAYGYDPDPEGRRLASGSVPQCRVDLRLTAAATLDLGGRRVEIVPTPGHSRGSLSLRDDDNGALLIADAVLGAAVPDAAGRPCFAPTYRHLEDYLDTITTLVRLDPELLLTTHFPTFDRSASRSFLVESAEFARRFEQLLLERLNDAPRSFPDLVTELNPVAGTWPTENSEAAVAHPLAGHLERLLRSGSVELLDDDVPVFVLLPRGSRA